MTGAELAARIDRLESIEAIRKIVADYAKWIDAKDLPAVARLFTDDTIVGDEVGREAKLRSLNRNHGAPGRFGTTIHLVAGHSIELDLSTPDAATGVVYCRAEHEIGDTWVVATIQYWDSYVRRDGEWLFRERAIKAYYVTDVLERPSGNPIKQHLSHHGVLETAELPGAWPSWAPFWIEQGRDPHVPAPKPA